MGLINRQASDPETHQVLSEAAKDESERVRVMAVMGLSEAATDDKESMQTLLEALKDQDTSVRLVSGQKLIDVEEFSDEAEEVLRDLLNDSSQTTAGRAAGALLRKHAGHAARTALKMIDGERNPSTGQSE